MYRFSFGRVDKVAKSATSRVPSLDALNIEDIAGDSSQTFVIGVYQEILTPSVYDRSGRLEKYLESIGHGVNTNNLRVLINQEEISATLICVGYDPTLDNSNGFIPEPGENTPDHLEIDPLSRVKVVPYYELDEIDFNKKRVPTDKEIEYCIKIVRREPSKRNIKKLFSQVEVFELAKHEFGLTRREEIIYRDILSIAVIE